MKQAALVLGIIAGVLGLIMGISVAGWIALTGWLDGQVPDALHQPQNAAVLKIVEIRSLGMENRFEFRRSDALVHTCPLVML